ncbi:MAG: amino acid--tRNA ligase-related protein, partial [Halieaceae bacterium]
MTDWRPSAKREALEARAVLLGQLRDFFEHRGVLEVETPLLCSAGVTDAAIEPF